MFTKMDVVPHTSSNTETTTTTNPAFGGPAPRMSPEMISSIRDLSEVNFQLMLKENASKMIGQLVTDISKLNDEVTRRITQG